MKRVGRATAGAAAILVALSLLLTGCSTGSDPQPTAPAASPSPTPAPLERYYEQQLSWEACEGGHECADVTVPIDYADPQGGDTTFAVLRQQPGDRELGYLVVNPGGPGASGIDYAKAASAVVSPQVFAQYNVVGFDPRGVARSNPIDCLTHRQLDRWIGDNADADTPADRERLLSQAAALGRGCAADDPKLVGHVDTAAVVKDLDVLRAALGSEKLNYLGFSYGSVVGALYDDEFAANVGRMVLDGVLPPDLTSDQIALGQAKGFEEALRRYVADCQEKPDCPVAGGSVAAGVAKVRRFLTGLERKPLRTNSDRPLTEALAAGAVLYYLYFPYAGDWNRLSQGLRSAFAGDGSTLLAMLDERLQRSPDGRYHDNAQEVFYAVNCLDRRSQLTTAELPALAEAWSQEAPTFGRYLAWSEAVCLQWPVPATGTPRQVTGSGSAPILLVATAHDPATPMQWAERLAESMANAHLVVWESDGHTAYTNGSSCVDDAVDAYLLEGTVPDEVLRCS